MAKVSLDDVVRNRVKDYEYSNYDLITLKALREDYNLFLQNYKFLNDFFELRTPLEIFTLYNYLLKKGDLSYNKELYYENLDTVMIVANDVLGGINVLSGKGMCYEISCLLNDILNNSNINSTVISSYVCDKDNNYREMAKAFVMALRVFGPDICKLSYIDAVANHSIVKTTSDKNYYFDALNDEVLVPKKIGRRTLETRGNVKIIINDKISPNTFSSFEDYANTREKIKSIYRSNKDVFNNFYRDNNEIYGDISRRVRFLHKGVIY